MLGARISVPHEGNAGTDGDGIGWREMGERSGGGRLVRSLGDQRRGCADSGACREVRRVTVHLSREQERSRRVRKAGRRVDEQRTRPAGGGPLCLGLQLG